MNKIIHVAQMSQCCLITNFFFFNKNKVRTPSLKHKNWHGRNPSKCLRTVLNPTKCRNPKLHTQLDCSQSTHTKVYSAFIHHK